MSKSNLQITKSACWLLRAMIVSCGNINCFEAMKNLEGVEGTVNYESIAKIPEYSYRLKAFERLEKFAELNNLTTIDLFDVAMYFGGDYHISVFEDFAHEGVLARYLGEVGEHFGLVGHVLLPLERNCYMNKEFEFEIEGAFVINPDEAGVPCFHLGLIVNIPLADSQVNKLLEVQYNNETFHYHLEKLPKKIHIPREYFTALNCIAERSSSAPSR
jgi:hypothetical protein